MIDAHVKVNQASDWDLLDADLEMSGVNQVVALLGNSGIEIPEDESPLAVVPRLNFEGNIRVQLDAYEHDQRVQGVWSELRDVSQISAKLLASLGFKLDLVSGVDELNEVIGLLDACPDLAVAWHCVDGATMQHARLLRELARRPQVYVKFSCVTPVRTQRHDRPLTHEVREVADLLLDSFGVKRIMAASGWNDGLGMVTYPAWLNTMDDLLCDLTSDESAAVYRATAEGFYSPKLSLSR